MGDSSAVVRRINSGLRVDQCEMQGDLESIASLRVPSFLTRPERNDAMENLNDDVFNSPSLSFLLTYSLIFIQVLLIFVRRIIKSGFQM